LRHGLHRFLLPDHSLVQHVGEGEELLAFWNGRREGGREGREGGEMRYVLFKNNKKMSSATIKEGKVEGGREGGREGK